MMTIRRILILIVLFVFITGPALAGPETDTATELAQAVIPPRDRIDLARRLLGVTNIAPPPAVPPQWHIGDVQTFWVTNSSENRTFQVEASLRTIGEHIYFWVEDGVEIDPTTLEKLANYFDNDIYTPMHHLFGSEASPGIDGDPRVYGLFTYGQGLGVGAYFVSEHTYPVEAVSTSNEHEMFFFNLDELGTTFSAEQVAGFVAHEFQHMIQEHLDTNESIWLNEGLSKFAEIYTGFTVATDTTAATFLSHPSTQLDGWPENGNGSTLPYYGAAMLFVTYFYDRFGEDALHDLARNQASGLESVDEVLAARGVNEDANAVFADWVMANFLQDTRLDDGRYGYRILPVLGGPPTNDLVTQYPFVHSDDANQYSTDYYVFNVLNGVTSLDLNVAVPDTVELVHATPPSGKRMWYSNKADNSDTTLTHRFDLTGVDHATLNFKLWYYIESLWDYGYVMVSTDDGATWTILETPDMSHDNPHNNAYGPGYTGFSNDWLSQSISLDQWAGQDILVRFEMITDDATTEPGMLIDDVSIPEIGYTSDFEADDGGWEARGWVWTDNTLPQQVWVQAAQLRGSDAAISRWLAPTESDWSLPLEPGVEQVMLAISPFAPLTTVPMPYTLSVTKNGGPPQ